MSPDFDAYIEVDKDSVRAQQEPSVGRPLETCIWIDAAARVRFAWAQLRMALPEGSIEDAEPNGDPRRVSIEMVWQIGEGLAIKYPDPGPKRKRPSWREWIREHYPVGPGQHRRHKVAYRYLRNLSRWFTKENLRALGYDPEKYGGVDEARWAWVLDQFNNPENFWRGDAWWNMFLGRNMREFEPFNWDFPTEDEEELEVILRAMEEEERAHEEQRAALEEERAREERFKREREEREREAELERRQEEERQRERERHERERRETEDRQRRERDRERDERDHERGERESKDKDRERERERDNRERRGERGR